MAWSDIENMAVAAAEPVPANGIRISARGLVFKSGRPVSRWIRVQIGKGLARKLGMTRDSHGMRLMLGSDDDAGLIGLTVAGAAGGSFTAKLTKGGGYSLTINAASASGLFALEFPAFSVADVAVLTPPKIAPVAMFRPSEAMMDAD